MAGPRIVVLSPWQPDQILALSTLPALVSALRARGADAHLHGRWDFDWQPGDLTAPRPLTWKQRLWRLMVLAVPNSHDPYGIYTPPDDAYGHPLRWREPPSRRAKLDQAFWASLDLTGVDVVVAPGWANARRALEHPTRRRGTRVVVGDFHMLEGAVQWARERAGDTTRIATGGWWPDDDLVVHACFPSFQTLYRNAGVPQDVVRWMPYPLHVPHHAGPVAPSDAAYVFAGGRHDRDWSTMATAASELGALAHPIHAHAPSDLVRSAGPVLALGEVDVATFCRAVRDSRFVIVPLHGDDASRAAGISVAALAIAAGRPVVGTDTPAMRDTVQEGVNAVLVPARDPHALAQAIRDLDADPERLARLGAGAQEASRLMDVAVWAERVLADAPPGARRSGPGAGPG